MNNYITQEFRNNFITVMLLLLSLLVPHKMFVTLHPITIHFIWSVFKEIYRSFQAK